MCKCMKLYSGYYGYDKCSCKGSYEFHKMLYPDFSDLCLRTNALFRSQENSDHHTGISLFCDLDIDMIHSFPINYMHQNLLGVHKKLLNMWFIERKGTGRLAAGQREEIDRRLLKLRPYAPKSSPVSHAH